MLYHWATGTFKLLILSQYYIDSSLDDKKVHENGIYNLLYFS